MSLAKGASCGTLDKAQAARQDLYDSTAYAGFDASKQSAPNYFFCDSVADDVQINAAEAYVTALGGGTVMLEQGTYTLADPIIPTGNQIWYKGQGRDTFIDGDGLATTEHAFHITGYTDIRISDLSIQTEDGGGKVSHCIFIEDGADNFHIHDVTIINSDSNAINIEGTTITQGHIYNCHIEGSDSAGILVDMDGAHSILRLYIESCDIGNCGASGIQFQPSTGNMYCDIIDNIIYSCTINGIILADGDYSQVQGNICILNGQEGIEIISTTHAQIADNISYSNTRHGILLVNSDYCTVEDNLCLENDSGDTATYDGINVDADSTQNMILGNECILNHRYGINVLGTRNSVNSNVCAENDRDGIYVNATGCLINDNYIYDNGQDAAGTYHGIHLGASADNSAVSGNHCNSPGDSQEDGIYLDSECHEVLITGNYCRNGMGSGISLADDNDYVSIVGNYCEDNDDYGVEITTANSRDARVKDNYLLGNGAPALLNGTNIELEEMIFPFVNGSVFLSDDTAASIGWEIDADTEYAATMGWIPNDVQQVAHLSIWGVTLATDADAMMLHIMLRTGLSNEAYNTEDVTLASHASDTTNFAAGDIVYWFVTPVDDSDLGDLMGGDAFYVKVKHAALSGDNIATDAVMYCATIGYV